VPARGDRERRAKRSNATLARVLKQRKDCLTVQLRLNPKQQQKVDTNNYLTKPKTRPESDPEGDREVPRCAC
jgi:hypothetical protein